MRVLVRVGTGIFLRNVPEGKKNEILRPFVVRSAGVLYKPEPTNVRPDVASDIYRFRRTTKKNTYNIYSTDRTECCSISFWPAGGCRTTTYGSRTGLFSGKRRNRIQKHYVVLSLSWDGSLVLGRPFFWENPNKKKSEFHDFFSTTAVLYS